MKWVNVKEVCTVITAYLLSVKKINIINSIEKFNKHVYNRNVEKNELDYIHLIGGNKNGRR